MYIKKAMEYPLVSIKCLVYNHEPYLQQCLEGFIMQKTNFAFEAIVHDDASTDNSAAIIREYAEKYPNIIKPIYEDENQYSKHNGSIQKIMNGAIHPNSKYIALCEGDDYWIDPFKLQKQYDFMERNQNCSMSFHNAVCMYDDKQHSSYIFNKLSQGRYVTIDDLITNWIVPTASMFYRKDLIISPEWSSEIYSGDLLLSLLCINNGDVYYLNEVMSVYRICYSNSSMTAYINKMKPDGYVQRQHIKLYEYFDLYTNGKYHENLYKQIRYLEKLIKYIKIRNISKYLVIILMPIFSIKRMKNKMMNLFV